MISTTPIAERTAPLLHEARGIVRDAIAAIRNLENLLRSPKVGPRALTSVLPGLQGLCVPLKLSLDAIVGHVAPRTSVGDTHRELTEFVSRSCGELQRALDVAAIASMDAKSRLRLESAVRKATAELDAVRELVEMLRYATESTRVELDFEQVIHEAFAVSSLIGSGANAGAIRVSAQLGAPGCLVVAHPQVMISALSLAIAMVHDAGLQPSIVSFRGLGERITVRISGDVIDGDIYLVRPAKVIAPTAACVESAARSTGGGFAVLDNARTVVLSWLGVLAVESA